MVHCKNVSWLGVPNNLVYTELMTDYLWRMTMQDSTPGKILASNWKDSSSRACEFLFCGPPGKVRNGSCSLPFWLGSAYGGVVASRSIDQVSYQRSFTLSYFYHCIHAQPYCNSFARLCGASQPYDVHSLELHSRWFIAKMYHGWGCLII